MIVTIEIQEFLQIQDKIQDNYDRNSRIFTNSRLFQIYDYSKFKMKFKIITIENQ